MRLIAFSLAALAPQVAFAWESEPQDLLFADEYDVFAAAEYDSGYLPAGSPLSVRFFIASDGAALTEMDATSGLTWPDALTQRIEGVPGTGWFALVTDMTLQAEVYFDLWGYTTTLPVWSEHLYLHDEAEFDPLLLPNAAVEQVEVSSEGGGIDPLEYSFGVFTGVDLVFRLEAWPRASAMLSGRRIETGESHMLEEGATSRLEVPDENPGWIDLSSVYVAWMDAALDVVLQPAMDVCVTLLGCYEVAAFEVPVTLVDVAEERAFEPVSYTHPLPSILPPFASHDFGEVPVGNLSNVQVPVSNMGLLDLEGYAWVEGDPAFSAYPTYFYASPDSTDGVVVTFAPEERGEYSALLVLESNDPTRPRLEIPLRAVAYSPDDFYGEDDELKGSIKTCGCSAAPVGGAPLLVGLLGLLAIRRRR